MLYITLNSRKAKRILIRIAVVSLLAMLFCMWALCARSAQQKSASSTDIPDHADLSPEFTVISTADTDTTEEIPSKGQSEEAAVPANVSLYPFTISQSVCLPLEKAFVSSEFGFRDHPVNGKYAFHSGLDLAAPEGTDIRAMLDGRIITARHASDYGNYVIIDHGSFQTLYAHCLTLCVSEGDQVTAGQKIAEVGSTGRATGNHLHVEFRCDGQRYDPAVILGDSYS